MSSLRDRINEELDTLRVSHGGLLKQEHIVNFARANPDSALWEDFDRQGLWNEKTAAEKARLDYASRIIRLFVLKPVDDQKPPVRALVSLIEDRKAGSGFPGYRHINDVMNDEALRLNLIQTALIELRACRRKYDTLIELSEVWDAVAKVETKFQPVESKKDEVRASV
jgi:hypothetical protein